MGEQDMITLELNSHQIDICTKRTVTQVSKNIHWTLWV